ncbi:hypothetical protein AMECASPLE_034959 [Ameca splendens]|uniref:Uncharacterized protein n=1 Tax=Ameca splendens TaxID=208324 RepID=A0ABV0ZGX6_9TELE
MIGCLIFVIPALHRKSLSWNTLRARKRAETRDGSFLGFRSQENSLLRKPKDGTVTPLPLALPSPSHKAKVSMAGRWFLLLMSCVCAKTLLIQPHFIFPFSFHTI